MGSLGKIPWRGVDLKAPLAVALAVLAFAAWKVRAFLGDILLLFFVFFSFFCLHVSVSTDVGCLSWSCGVNTSQTAREVVQYADGVQSVCSGRLRFCRGLVKIDAIRRGCSVTIACVP